MITTDPAAVVTRYIYAVRDGDSGAIRDSFAEDAIWEYPGDLPLSGTWRGRDTIVDDFLGSVGTALEPGSTVALEVTSVLTAGDQVVAEWTSRATARGGAAYHNRNVGIFTVRDGKIAAVREYTDTQHAAHVLFGSSRLASFGHVRELLSEKIPLVRNLLISLLFCHGPRTASAAASSPRPGQSETKRDVTRGDRSGSRERHTARGAGRQLAPAAGRRLR